MDLDAVAAKLPRGRVEVQAVKGGLDVAQPDGNGAHVIATAAIRPIQRKRVVEAQHRIEDVEAQAETHKSDRVEFILEPFQSVEYKYLMDMDASMVFSWVADGEVYYDMHAEPAGLGPHHVQGLGPDRPRRPQHRDRRHGKPPFWSLRPASGRG